MFEYRLWVTRVLDGDTVDGMIDLGFDIHFQTRVRMTGIDTPEVHTTDLREKRMGEDARDRLQEILGVGTLKAAQVVVRTEKPNSTEKFGRVLGTLLADGVNVNELMVTEGYAWRYDGGAKRKDLDALASIRRQRAGFSA